jgi:hypothetical protein
MAFLPDSTLESWCYSEPPAGRRSREFRGPLAAWNLTAAELSVPAGASSGVRIHRLGKIAKEVIGDFLGRAVDQPLAKLRQLAADLRLHRV